MHYLILLAIDSKNFFYQLNDYEGLPYPVDK